jgi:transketolase
MSDWTYEPIRKGFGRGLVKAAELDEHVVALCADLTESTQISLFKEKFPERFFEVGIAEQNLVTVASGLASQGFIPFTSSYAAFSPGRNWEQIRTTACLNEQPVVIVGSHAGLMTGLDGATHQILEDIALMRVLPHMTVIVPCDSIEAEKATLLVAKLKLPSYLRLARDPSAVVTAADSPFEIGKAYVLREGSDVTIVACGTMVEQSLLAAELLASDNISAEVINCPTIKPLDRHTILTSALKTGKVVTAEEHQVTGGLGSAVAELLALEHPTKMAMIGVQDKFGQSGTPAQLFQEYGVTANHIAMKAHTLL